VIVVLLLGVLAAGLLAVVQADIESAVQTNRGQRAFDLADAGARAAAGQLRADPDPEHYDADVAENTTWAYVHADGGAPGEEIFLGEGSANVEIRYLTPARTAEQQADGSHAPEKVPAGSPDYPDGDFFLVVSEGASGETRRKVEAILRTARSGDPAGVFLWSWREVYE